MDAALTPRAFHTAAPALPRADVTPVPAAVPSLLPQPSQSVAATARSSAGRFDGSDTRGRARAEVPGGLLSDELVREIEREVEINEETNDLVLKTRDGATGRIINQFPAEALLKLRAYVQSEAAKDADPLIVRTA